MDQQAPPLRARLRNQTRPPRSHGPPRHDHDHDQATRPNLTVFKHPLTLCGHGKRVVDAVSCRGHHQIRAGVCEVVKEAEGAVLDAVVEVTRWTRDNARRRLVAAAHTPSGGGRRVASKPRNPRTPKFSYDALKVLQKVWAASGGQCGKYLAASMQVQLDGLERHGELIDGQDRYGPRVRAELLAMSPPRSTGTWRRRKPRISFAAGPRRNPLRCCGLRSRSARPGMRSEPNPGSSRATPSRTADRR